MSDARQTIREAVRLLAHGDIEAAKGKLMIQYLHAIASGEIPPTMPIYLDDLAAEGVSLDEFKRLCAEMPGPLNPFRPH